MSQKEEPVHLRTFDDLIRHGYQLTGHCRRCSVHKAIDLAQCPANRSYVGARFKCRVCAGVVEITLSPSNSGADGTLPALDRWRER